MSLSPGHRLGPYEIVAPLGAGGMGEVYRARDTRLDRTVAIKVLPASLALDSQFRDRFDREARAISQLDHPHICALHDVGERDGVAYLVMQYLEGETLASRLAAASVRRDGPGLPLEQALTIAIQIASALDGAHRAGIVHRDLKPSNVMLTSAGAKLLDFGLAKSSPAPVAAGGASMLATTPPGLTAQGAILGTLQYMAPEQLEGGVVDSRTDIFAFGALVHEMCTGTRAFDAKSNAGLVAAILEHEPVSISRVQPLAPAALDRVVKTCLAKRPDDRWQSARDLLRELEWVAEGRSSPDRVSEPTATATRRRWLTNPALAWGVALLSVIGIVAVLLMRTAPAPSSPSVPPAALRLTVTLPDGARLAHSGFPALALSPDGSRLAYVAERQGVSRLYLRQMDTFETREVPDSEGAVSPFFSPDGRWVGFAGGGKLKKVSISGGQPIALADAVLMWGATWGPDDTIVFGQGDVGLSRVSSSGGPTTAATTLDPMVKEGGHLWPHLLPDGKSMLLTVGTVGTNMERARIVLHSLETGKRRVLIEGGTNAQYLSSGHIVYGVGGSLMAAPFDLASGTIAGASVPVFHGVTRSDLGVSQFSVSRTGVLVFAPGPVITPKRTLSWVDRTGTEIPLPLPARAYWPPRLSPDGRRLALGIEGPSHDVWVSDVDRDTLSRLTSGADSYWPMWTRPDGSRIIFQSNKTGPWNLFWIPVDGTGPEQQLVRSDTTLTALFTLPDGDLVYGDIFGSPPGGVWRVPINDPRSPRRLERWNLVAAVNPVLSPDGHWLAYVGNASGRNEIYVQRFPEGGLIRQVTRDGGVTPAWSRNGRELFYVTDERVKAIDVISSKSELAFGKPRDLFKIPFPLFGPGIPLEVSPDGQRFLFVKQGAVEPGPTQINFVVGAGFSRP